MPLSIHLASFQSRRVSPAVPLTLKLSSAPERRLCNHRCVRGRGGRREEDEEEAKREGNHWQSQSNGLYMDFLSVVSHYNGAIIQPRKCSRHTVTSKPLKKK